MVELIGIQRLVCRAAGNPQVQPVGAADQAIDVNPDGQDPEAGQRAAIELRQYRTVRIGADVEGFAAPAETARIG